ncbi:Eco57I restriction-modification methylase domain-containing protein [Enterocloster bolteae]|uniref:Eco57I restriction-modification methylase domain-containing protein n=1 Tax=Enterocloster bolteae TaxID=208479 RepID=UPI000E42D4C6|nr:N-6 DNA methylase [Enterocloster bolteae]RGK65914.1 type II restriction endonuclease subunit M [Enterocloster bolteae]
MRYANIKKEKTNGVVYTPTVMADYLSLEMIRYKPCNSNSTGVIRVLDPAVGKGELLISFLKAIKKICTVKIEVVGYETDMAICKETRETLSNLFPDVELSIRNEDFLKAVEEQTTGLYDYVIANPPYVRTQIIGSEKAQKMSSKLKLSGRIDIYYAFIICTKSVLKDDGIAGYITSNKFLTIKSGAAVRNYIIDNYKIHRIIDFGDTKLFSASVLPCIMVFSKGKTTQRKEVLFTSVYQASKNQTDGNITNIFDAIHKSGCYKTPDDKRFMYQQGVIQSVDKDCLWNIQSNESPKWLSVVESNTWQRFFDIGKIRVGIKTTADNVFIGNDWNGDKANIELLRPLITHRNAGQFLPNNTDLWKVLYTHTSVNGKKVAYDIEDYPYAKQYLSEHFEQLSSRKYVIQAKRNWYEIWVPQNPESWKKRKIVFRDISEQPQFWLDTSGAIVNGDCYWIEIYDHVIEDVIYLALAIANSRFIEKYYDVKFNTKLYSGKRRYMSQYVEQFPIPLYTTELAQEAISLVKKIIAEKKQSLIPSYKDKLNDIVDEIFT